MAKQCLWRKKFAKLATNWNYKKMEKVGKVKIYTIRVQNYSLRSNHGFFFNINDALISTFSEYITTPLQFVCTVLAGRSNHNTIYTPQPVKHRKSHWTEWTFYVLHRPINQNYDGNFSLHKILLPIHFYSHCINASLFFLTSMQFFHALTLFLGCSSNRQMSSELMLLSDV